MNKVKIPAIVTSLFILLSRPLAADETPFGPQPGDVYREYIQYMYWPKEWRVSDPETEQPRAIRDYLPNPVLPIYIDDMTGAIRAEAQMDRWGGHVGTSGKRVRFNDNDWIDLPELTTTPDNQDPLCFFYEDNPIVAVPLAHLREGENTFEGTADEQVCHSFGWGQWGWYMMIVRVYFEKSVSHPEARITSPQSGVTLAENPTLSVDAKSEAGIERVDFLAHYNGFDENGDGIYGDWHHNYHFLYRTLEGGIQDHIGSVTSAPYDVVWDTKWIPDQPEGSMKIAVRILDKGGMWYVTDAVEGISLQREDTTVAMYTSFEIPENFRTRMNNKKTCKFLIPNATDMSAAVEAAIHIRTWNGAHENVILNGWTTPIDGEDHDFAYNIRDFPAGKLHSGENLFEFISDTHHHGPEILWPGPAVTVRFTKNRTVNNE
jgi:hypothetical protein